MGGKQCKHAHMYHLRSSQCWRGVYGAFVRIPGLFSAISKKTTRLTARRVARPPLQDIQVRHALAHGLHCTALEPPQIVKSE
jgi:hypothetical protein